METGVNGQTKLEEGELDEDAAPQVRQTSNWKKGTGPAINVDRIKQLMNKVGKEESDSDESSDDGDLVGGVNLAGIVVDDDDADELAGMLERTRRLKQQQAAQKSSSGAEKVREMLTMNGTLRDEDAMENEDDDVGEKRGIVIDATSEYYKSIGDIPTYGLAGNRDDDVDYSELLEERAKLASQKVIKEEQPQSDESEHEIEEKPAKKKHKRRESERSKEGSPPPSTSRDRHGEKNNSRRRQQSESDEEVFGDDYKNVLGEEKDVTKGVAAMLKLAGEKGYLEPANSRRNGDSGLKQSLESKRFSRVEQGRFDIEDKYIKKLERMGTTGTGPVRPFPEKRDYVPNVEISYTDQKGRILEQKEAFRELSWKFHGKGPGKKQIEKRQAQQDKKERLKKMNSSDTPLGTLQKQLKKQEQVQTPYLILSGAGKDNGTQLQKE
jgi:U4/U6.U5 tri-snRNP-associated protein 1